MARHGISLRIGATLVAALQGAPAAAQVAAQTASAPIASASNEQAVLIALFGEFQAWQRGLSGDYGRPAMARRLAALADLQRRHAALPVAGWPREAKVDWLVVRSELDRAEFLLKVTRPWARDPGFYLESIQRMAFTELPAPGLKAQLARVPAMLAASKPVLDDMARDHVDLALRSLTMSDGVEDGFPARPVPPPGVIGWLQDLRQRATTQQPDLLPEIDAALAALADWQRWLTAQQPRITAPAGVGTARLDWYLKTALQMPWDSAAALAISQRELDRLMAFTAIAEHRNAKLPKLAMAANEADYKARVAETDARVRRFLSGGFMTIPPGIPDRLSGMVVPPYSEPYNVPFARRATPPNFWEQVQYRDPSPDHLHAVIPGHRMDLMLANAHPNPIRRAVNDGARWQGWAVYLEEAALQAGFFDDRPRVKELIYIFGLWRAARSVGDIWNQQNVRNAGEVAAWWQQVTPFLDPDVARKYAHIRALPGHGLEYTMGNVQMWELLAARRRQLGERFDLKAFHDDFIRRGRIPIALIRYEMTGDETMWPALKARPPIPE